ncbi:endosulfine alpha b isoform X2 [Clupea harengus]|uniref:Endosulfine alpha b isoform X2 n=1 Tax=Clupea harengus TaxID=7950 RepID=A0A6P3VK30_CLUHA|nr:endosulfine alpha b isoform X2 [Clupea harengus]
MSSPAETQSDHCGDKKDSQENQTTTGEVKRKSKYPSLGQKPGGSEFLMKRLEKKGQKYFDSGDYNMAKAKKSKQLPAAPPDRSVGTGDHIPTPQDLPQRRPSLVTSKLVG